MPVPDLHPSEKMKPEGIGRQDPDLVESFERDEA
jgi:hypothetical protein